MDTGTTSAVQAPAEADENEKATATAPGKKQSLRERIRGSQDTRSRIVHVDEWGVDIEVRSMTGDARIEAIERASDADDKLDMKLFYPTVLLETCFDPETGEPAFETGDIEWLGKKNAGALERLAKVALAFSGLGKNADEESKKDSSETQSAGSSTR